MTQVRQHIPVATPSVSVPPPLTKRKSTNKKPKPRPSAARPSPPPIHLPDPSQSHPLPPNLLRNQPGLLGTAGVVAGVRPAHLPARAAPAPIQGTTSSNPIFVDDEVRPPTVSRFKRPRCDIDPASLPPPSNQDIVSTLIKERDIFPLLESILKFIAAQAPPSRSSSDAGSRSQTPSDESSASRKRRKLRHVPAGAALWDVPFPFNEGEGPTAYRNEWEKDRGKKLITELVALIKGAASRAAVTNHVEGRKTPTELELASIGKHYRVDTLFYGSNTPTKCSEQEVLADASNASRTTVAPSFNPSTPAASSASALSIPSDSSSTSTPFDQLISSLLSASSNEQLSLDSGSGPLGGSFDPSGPLDTGLFDSWMDIFQTFPVPAAGFTPAFKSENYHIDPTETLLTIPDSLVNPMHPTHSPALSFDFPSGLAHGFPEMTSSTQSYYNTTLDNLMIDPLLLSLSTPSTLPGSIDTSASGSNFSDSGCPSLAGSPAPSTSSYSFGPMTPTETGWNGDAAIGVYSPGDEHRATDSGPSIRPSAVGKGKKRDFSNLTGWTDAEKEALSFLEVLSKSKAGSLGKGKGKAKVDEDSSQDGAGTPAADGGGKQGKDDGFSRLRTLHIVGSLTKADVLKRAKERREELNLEIAKTRIALWETTIEGGVLAGLVKYYGKS